MTGKEFAIDLNAVREARQAGKSPVQVKYGKRTYTLPLELPLEVFGLVGKVEAAGPDAAKAASELVEVLLGDQAQDFMAQGPSIEDLAAVFESFMTSNGNAAKAGEPS